tara:strand:+ start:529 stop:858 length:330 start_codon:yes stop_codon:yes gene_type:complete
MTQEEFNKSILQVYDNLTEEQFNYLMKESIMVILKKAYGNGYEAIFKKNTKVVDELESLQFENNFDKLALSVLITTFKSKRISFKQFKVLSAFSKVKWIEEEKETFKQF